MSAHSRSQIGRRGLLRIAAGAVLARTCVSVADDDCLSETQLTQRRVCRVRWEWRCEDGRFYAETNGGASLTPRLLGARDTCGASSPRPVAKASGDRLSPVRIRTAIGRALSGVPARHLPVDGRRRGESPRLNGRTSSTGLRLSEKMHGWSRCGRCRRRSAGSPIRGRPWAETSSRTTWRC